MTRDGRFDVEFVDLDGGAGEADEDLVLPPRRAVPGTARQRYVVAVVLVLLVLVGVAAHGLRHPSTPTAARSSATPAAPTGGRPARSEQAAHRNDPDGITREEALTGVPRITAPPSCPQADDGQPACRAVHTVPAAFLAAVRQRFPNAKQTSTLTEQVRPAGAEIIHAIWSRTFTARTGVSTMTIVVRPGHDADSFPVAGASNDNGQRVLAYSQHRTKSYTVEVQLTAPSGHEPSLERMAALCSDPRLVALD